MEIFLCTDLVGDVMDSDVMHGCSVTLEQRMKVSPTVPETGGKTLFTSSVKHSTFFTE